MLDRQAK